MYTNINTNIFSLTVSFAYVGHIETSHQIQWTL